jgi:hypothetical protein
VLLCLLGLPISFVGGLRRLDRLYAGDSCLKLLDDPDIEALAGNACRQIDLAIKLRRNAGDELARKRLVRLTLRPAVRPRTSVLVC